LDEYDYGAPLTMVFYYHTSMSGENTGTIFENHLREINLTKTDIK